MKTNDSINLKEHLPHPILPTHPQWVDLYWRAWEIARGKIKRGTPENGFVEAFMDEAFSDQIFQWDTCFMAIFARYGQGIFPGIVSLDNFYRKQHPDGFICRKIHEADGRDAFGQDSDQAINPPLFAWAEKEHYEFTGDSSRFPRVLPILTRYYQWVKAHRRRQNGLYWTSNLGSGMDNSPRDGHAWVDLSAQQALAARCLADIAATLGEEAVAAEYRAEYQELTHLINDLTWDEGERFYYDLYPDGSRSRVKTVAAFWPLLAGIADDQQAEGLVAHLTDPAEFWRPHLIPTLAADHPAYDPQGGYWLGSVWAPTNYAIIKGLEQYGYTELARQAAENHLANMAAVYRDTGTIWENYAPEASAPGNRAKPDFVGWSGLGPIALLIEIILGLRVHAPSNTLRWRLRPREEHGIRGLRFGDNTVDLVARPGEGTVTIQVAAERRFTLELDTELGSFVQEVPPGTHGYILLKMQKRRALE